MLKWRRRTGWQPGEAETAYRRARAATRDAERARDRLGLLAREAELVHGVLRDHVAAGEFDDALTKKLLGED